MLHDNILPHLQTVACLGDSLTAGSISFDYFEVLKSDPRLTHFRFKNHGIDGDLAWNVLQRLAQVIADKPDVVSIMIGTNDVNCTLSERNRLRYVEFNKLPITHPDLSWFEENLRAIVTRLRNETEAEIVMLSLPMIGEDLAHLANQRMPLYNEVIRQVAHDFQTGYLPLHEKMMVYLNEHEADRASLPPRLEYRDGLVNIGNATALHAMGLTWDEVSARNGLLLTTDCIHLNGTGGKMIAELLSLWLQNLGKGT